MYVIFRSTPPADNLAPLKDFIFHVVEYYSGHNSPYFVRCRTADRVHQAKESRVEVPAETKSHDVQITEGAAREMCNTIPSVRFFGPRTIDRNCGTRSSMGRRGLLRYRPLTIYGIGEGHGRFSPKYVECVV